MKRKGIFRPTIEDAIEISGVETLHPGGMAITHRAGEVAGLKSGMTVLDVSSGRGTQAIYYAQAFGARVVGLDMSEEMLAAAIANAEAACVRDKVEFQLGESQSLPFGDGTFDVVINECAVGIPDDSQRVLDEMVRAVKPGGIVVIHESTWRSMVSPEEKDELSERYGTTPLELHEWKTLLEKAGVENIQWEFDRWSSPEMFWNIRKGRSVTSPSKIFTLSERMRTVWRLLQRFGLRGVQTALRNEKFFFRTVFNGKLGYCLFWGRRAVFDDEKFETIFHYVPPHSL